MLSWVWQYVGNQSSNSLCTLACQSSHNRNRLRQVVEAGRTGVQEQLELRDSVSQTKSKNPKTNQHPSDFYRAQVGKRIIETRLALAFLCSSGSATQLQCAWVPCSGEVSHFSPVSPFRKEQVWCFTKLKSFLPFLGVGGFSAMDYVEETEASTKSTWLSGPRKHVGGQGQGTSLVLSKFPRGHYLHCADLSSISSKVQRDLHSHFFTSYWLWPSRWPTQWPCGIYHRPWSDHLQSCDSVQLWRDFLHNEQQW